MKSSFFKAIVLISAIPMFQVVAQTKESERVETAIQVVQDASTIPDNTIPAFLFEKAEGVAIIPGVIKGAFGIGGRWGEGIMVVRSPKTGWSDPCFVSLTGGSVGWQIGVESTDLVLIFMTPRSVKGVVNGKIILGADASVAAGPVGRNAEANTNGNLTAEILSYARGRGLFAGASVQGSAMQIDNTGNIQFYKDKDVNPEKVFAGKVLHTPAAVATLKSTLAKLSQGESVGTDTKSGEAKSTEPEPPKKENAKNW